MTAEELFGKHFNGIHYADITMETIVDYAKEYAKLKCKEQRQKCKANLMLNDFQAGYKYADIILNAPEPTI